MAITVIERGVNPDEQPRQIRCYNCSSLLQFHRSDVTSDHRSGQYIKCPVCDRSLNTATTVGMGDR